MRYSYSGTGDVLRVFSMAKLVNRQYVTMTKRLICYLFMVDYIRRIYLFIRRRKDDAKHGTHRAVITLFGAEIANVFLLISFIPDHCWGLNCP